MEPNITKWLFATVLFTLISACGGGGGGNDNASEVTTSYNGPGSYWQVTLNKTASTFQITKSEDVGTPVVLTIDGSYTETPEGFLDMEIGSVGGPDATAVDAPRAGGTAYGLEIPGVAFLLKSRGGDPAGAVIAMVSSGNCPSADTSLNWIKLRKPAGQSTDGNHGFFGNAAWDNTAGILTVNEYNLSFAFSSSPIGIPVTCADGIAEASDGSTLYFAENDSVIVESTTSDRITLAFPTTTVASITDFDGKFSGFLQDEGSGADFARRLVFDCNAGVCDAKLLDGTGAGSFTIGNGINNPIDGFVTGEVNTDGGHTGNLACMADTALGGKKVLSCVGQSPKPAGGVHTEMMSAILVSQ